MYLSTDTLIFPNTSVFLGTNDWVIITLLAKINWLVCPQENTQSEVFALKFLYDSFYQLCKAHLSFWNQLCQFIHLQTSNHWSFNHVAGNLRSWRTSSGSQSFHDFPKSSCWPILNDIYFAVYKSCLFYFCTQVQAFVVRKFTSSNQVVYFRFAYQVLKVSFIGGMINLVIRNETKYKDKGGVVSRVRCLAVTFIGA